MSQQFLSMYSVLYHTIQLWTYSRNYVSIALGEHSKEVVVKIDLLRPIEQLSNIAIGGFENQMQIIRTLGPHPERAERIDNLKQMALELSEVIEKNKEDIVQHIDDWYTSLVHKSAELRDLHKKTAANTNDLNLKESAQLAIRRHDKLVKSLGPKEFESEQIVLRRFGAIKKNIDDLLFRIEEARR